MKFKLCIFLLIIKTFCFNSCDILRFSLFEVSSWSPGGGYHPDPENTAVSVNFSRSPDTASVERSFSLTGNGNRIKGTFRWEGKKMTFAPLSPLEKNTDYVINISADAHDTKGLSMDEDFYGAFTTRPDNTRPVLLSCYPPMYGEADDPRMEISLWFSLPVPLNTLYENVSFSPSMTGFWRLEDEEKLAVFTPAEPWQQHTRYEIRLSSSLTDNNGMNIGSDFLSVFTAGTDHESPYLLYARRISKDGSIAELTPDSGYSGIPELLVENKGWEKDDMLSLVFSEPVDSISVKNYLSAENAPALALETSPGFNTEHIFRFDSAPPFESSFTLKIKPGIKDIAGNESKDEYIYRITADGKYSKPPVLAGIRIPLAPDSESDLNLFFAGKDEIFKDFPITDDGYPSKISVQTWIELYFDTAESASIDTFSLMELFRIENSNNVISFSPQRIKTGNFTVTEPHPDWENFQRVEITGSLTNTTNFGLIYFLIGAGLADSLGNKNENQLRISVMK